MTLTARYLLGSLCSIALLAAPAAAQTALDLVVRVSCDASTGGGIVSRSTTEGVEVVTAKHVVERCLGATAGVEFSLPGARGKVFRGEVVDPQSTLDVALVRIADRGAPRFTLEQLHMVGDSLAIRSGAPVKPVVHIQGQSWLMPQRSDLVVLSDGDLIEFQSQYVDAGASGGALLNVDGLIVGMIVSDTPRTGRALPIHRIQLNLTSRRFDVAWGPPDARRSAEPPAGALPVRPVDPPPPVDEIVHGNIIYQMPRDWRRMQVSRTEHVLYGQTEPPFGPHIMLRTGGRLRAEFRQTVEASLAEGDNITAYRELRFGSHNGIRMYRMDGAEMKTERGAIQYLYYAALNAGDRFDEIVLLTYSNYGPSAEAARRAFDMLLSTVDLVNAREARNAR